MAHYFYTETAFHHMGEMDFMKRLIKASAEINAAGIKFQVLIDYDSFFSEEHSMYTDFRRAMFTVDEWREIFRYTHSLGLDIIFMPICTDAFQLLKDDSYSIKYIDIHSVSFYDEGVLSLIKQSGIPVILGIGGRNSDEIDAKLRFFGDQLKVIMVGFQAFPSKIEELRLGKIQWLMEKYSKLSIGYADHSSFESEHAIVSNEWAFLLGATFFEKHITVAEGEDRWDFQSAISVERCKILIERLKFLDNDVMRYQPNEFDIIEGKELVYRNRQKIAVAKGPLSMGHVLGESDIALKMLDSTEGIVDWKSLLGKRVSADVKQGEKLYANNTAQA